jgi:sortase A
VQRRRAHTKPRQPRVEDRRRERLLVVASWVRNIGAIILLFVAWQLWGTSIAQHHAQSALKSQFEGKIHHPVAKPAPGFTLIPATTRIPDPPNGTPMANLQIPKIDLNEVVVSGTDEGDLAKGPGHYLGTAMPGQAGNVAIAGHRTTHGAPFNRLAELAIGDPIYLTTASGQKLTYIVSAVPVPVSPSDVTVLNNFGDDRLTLTTCNPEYSARQRLIVVAAYLPPGATHPAPIAKGTGRAYALAPAETSGWNTTLLPLVAIELLALVGLGLTYRRLSRVYGKGTEWIILGPVWIALLIALFETLTNFLPAAV